MRSALAASPVGGGRAVGGRRTTRRLLQHADEERRRQIERDQIARRGELEVRGVTAGEEERQGQQRDAQQHRPQPAPRILACARFRRQPRRLRLGG